MRIKSLELLFHNKKEIADNERGRKGGNEEWGKRRKGERVRETEREKWGGGGRRERVWPDIEDKTLFSIKLFTNTQWFFHVLSAKKLFLHSKFLFVISLKAITLGRLLSGENSHANSHYTLSRAWSVMYEELCPYEEVHGMLRRETIWWLFGKGETEVSKAQQKSQKAKCLPNSVRSIGRGTQPALQLTEMTRNQNKKYQAFSSFTAKHQKAT